MFESYSERARRVVFYAREAVSKLGGSVITPDHLFLGVLREKPGIVQGKGRGSFDVEQIIEILESWLRAGMKVPTSIDVPVGVVGGSFAAG